MIWNRNNDIYPGAFEQNLCVQQSIKPYVVAVITSTKEEVMFVSELNLEVMDGFFFVKFLDWLGIAQQFFQ